MPMSDEQATELMRKYLKNQEELSALKRTRDDRFNIDGHEFDGFEAERQLGKDIHDFETNSYDLNKAAETRQDINNKLMQNEITPRNVMTKARNFEKLQNSWGNETPFTQEISRSLKYLKDAHVGALKDQGFEFLKKDKYKPLPEENTSILKQYKMKNPITGEQTGASTPQALLEMLAIMAAEKAVGAPELASQSPQELSVEDPNSPEFKRRRAMVDALAEIKRQNQK
jgi:hypothetical protein